MKGPRVMGPEPKILKAKLSCRLASLMKVKWFYLKSAFLIRSLNISRPEPRIKEDLPKEGGSRLLGGIFAVLRSDSFPIRWLE